MSLLFKKPFFIKLVYPVTGGNPLCRISLFFHKTKTPLVARRVCFISLETKLEDVRLLITRYLFRHLFIVTCAVVAALTAVIWLTQSLKLLELVASADAPALLFFKLVLLTLPKFLEVILPLALVVAVLFTYQRLTADNEIIVMRASGVSPLRLAAPALALAALMTVALLLLTSFVSPLSAVKLLSLRDEVQTKYSTFLLREGVFNTFGDDLTVYLRRRGPQGDLYGLMIHDMREKDTPSVIITAKRGHISTDEDTPSIIVYDGIRQQKNENNNTISRLHFARYTIEIKTLETAAGTRWHKAAERTILQLMHPDAATQLDARQKRGFIAEINSRLAMPFNALGFTAVALACILLGAFSRRGQAKKVVLAAVLVIGLQVLCLALDNLMKQNTAFAVALYAACLGPVVAGIWCLQPAGAQSIARIARLFRRRPAFPAAEKRKGR